MSMPEMINKPEENVPNETTSTELPLMVAQVTSSAPIDPETQITPSDEAVPTDNNLNGMVGDNMNYEGTKSKKRKKKDPKAPRRPLSAYNIFFKAVREEIHSTSNERPSFSGLVQLVSKRWRETLPEEKTKYELQAKEDYQRYSDEMTQYRQRPEVQSVLIDPNAAGNKRRCKFLGVSKRPLSGYNIFFREEHARLKKLKAESNSDIELACMTVTIAKKWSELSEAEKSELNKRAADTQRAAEEAETQRELQRKAASMKNAQMMPQGYGPQGAHPALLAHYHDYYAARLQQMNQQTPARDLNYPAVQGLDGAMPPTEPQPKDGDVSAQQANWDAILKQQQEQHFQQQYMQWCFEQIQQQQQLGQWQQYQQQQGQPQDQDQQQQIQDQQQQQQQIMQQQQQQQQQQIQQQQQQQQQLHQQQQIMQQQLQQQIFQQQQQQQQQLEMQSTSSSSLDDGLNSDSPTTQSYLDQSSFN